MPVSANAALYKCFLSKQASGNFDASTLSTYGLLKAQGKAYLDALFNALEDGGLIETSTETFLC